MKISEAIELLAKIKEESGDLDVINLTDTDSDKGYLVEFNKTFETIGIPSQVGDEEALVVAFIEPLVFEPSPTPEPRKSKMTIVK